MSSPSDFIMRCLEMLKCDVIMRCHHETSSSWDVITIIIMRWHHHHVTSLLSSFDIIMRCHHRCHCHHEMSSWDVITRCHCSHHLTSSWNITRYHCRIHEMSLHSSRNVIMRRRHHEKFIENTRQSICIECRTNTWNTEHMISCVCYIAKW